MVPSPTRHARVRAHAGLVAARRYFAHYPGPPGPDFHAAERDLAAALRDLAHGDPLRDEVSFVLGAIRIADHEMRCANPCPAPDELVPIAGLLAAGGERPGAPAARLYPYAMTVDKLYDHTRDPAHIDLAITWLRAAAGHRDVSPGDRRRALLSLAIQHASKGAALRDSQGRSGPGTPSWAAFDAAIRQFEAVLAELDEHGGKSDPAIATDRLDTWLGLLETYYQRGGDQARDDDLDAMAALARNLISHLEPGYRLRSYALGRSGVLLMQRIMRQAGDGWDQALEAAMRSFQPTTIREVLTTVPGFEADLAAADDALAMAVGLENPASRWQPLFTAAACAVRGLRYLAHGGKENIQGFGRLCRIVMGYPDLDPVYRRSCSEFLLVVMVHQLADSGAELGLLRRSAAGLLPSGHEALDVMIGLLARFAAADGARMDPALSWALASAVNIRAAGELTDTELAASYARQCAAATAYANLPTVHAVLLAEAAITGAEWARRGTGPAGLTDQVAAAFSDALGSFPPSHPITIDLATRASKFAGDIPPDLGAFSPRVLASPGTASHGLVAASPGQAAEIARSALDPPPRKAERQAAVRSVLALALGTRWVRERNDEYLAEAISQLRWAIGLVRQRHPLHAPLTGLLAGMLLDRAWTRGDHADVDAALALLENQPTITAGPSLNVLLAQTGPPALRPLLSTGDVPSAGLTEAAIGSALLLRGLLSHSDGRDLSEAARLLAQVAAGLPADDPRRPGVLSDLGLALFAGDDTTGLRSGLDTLREALAACPAGHPQEPAIMLRVAAALAANAHAAYDPRIVDQSVELLRRALRSAGRDSYGERSRCLYSLGYTLLVRFSRGGQRTDLDAAIDALEESRAGLEPVPGDPFTVPVLRLLAWAHRRAGEAGSGTHRSLARSIGRSVLHARAETRYGWRSGAWRTA
jgi:tetratricopeptide (TPR) repeat protein